MWKRVVSRPTTTIHSQRYKNQGMPTSVRRQRLLQTWVPESSQLQHGSGSSDLHADATDSDSDSPDDDQASADVDAATVNMTDASDNANATDYCEVSGSPARTSTGRALATCDHLRFCEQCIHHLESLGSGCPVCCVDINMVLRLF